MIADVVSGHPDLSDWLLLLALVLFVVAAVLDLARSPLAGRWGRPLALLGAASAILAFLVL